MVIASLAAALALVIAIVWPRTAASLREWQLVRAAADGPRRSAGRLVGLAHTALSAKRGLRRDATATALDEVAVRVLQARRTTPHVRGKAALLKGRTSEAVEALRVAAAKGGPEAQSDLAAALVAEAEEFDSHGPALDAVVAARKALSSNPALAPAHFNLALALQSLGLLPEARAEFVKAAALEPRSSWADESRKRASAIGVPLIDWQSSIDEKVRAARDPATRKALIESNVESARRFAEGPYLVAWARARIDGRKEEAGRLLDLLREIAGVVAETSNDQFVAVAVQGIDRAEQRGESFALELARALATYGEGRIAFSERDSAKGHARMSQAGSDLARLGSPVQYAVRYYSAAALYEEMRVDDVLRIIQSLDREELEAKGYLSLNAQLEWERGISYLVRGSYAEALHAFELGYTRSMANGNREQAAIFDGLAAEALEYLGESRDAWARRARAVAALSSFPSVNAVMRRTTTLTSAANLQIAARDFDRANAILEYAVPLAVRTGDPVVIANAFAQRAATRAELRDVPGASSDRAAAARAASAIPDPAVRARIQIDLEIASGVARRQSSPQAAIAHFTSAITALSADRQSALLPRLYFERARAYEAAGDVAHVRQDLRSVLEVIEGWEESTRNSEQRAAIGIWSDASRRDLISLELRQNDVGAAFSHADARRTAAPRDAASPARRSRISHIDVQRALAPNAAIIEFVTTRNALVVFIIRQNDVRAVTLPANVARIAAAARAMREAEDDELKPAAAALYALVIAPIRERLAGITTLAVIPDRELTGISFGALHDSVRDRFLIEEIAVVHNPTARGAIEWSRLSQPARERTLLSIGASVFDRRRYPDAAGLSAVDREADSIARLSPTAHRLLGSNATPAAVARELSRAAVVHYAGHIVDRGADARLLLAPFQGRASLTAREIADLRLDGTRVVVLAACRGSGTTERHAIVQDMASGFLAAGVQTVVASATDVDDAEAPETMVRLHRFLAEGADVADALRKTAQMDRKAGKAVPLSIRLMVMGGSRSLVR